MTEQQWSHAGLGKNRLEALTDGIFAFALTVLVLNIEIPDALPIPLPPNPVQAQLVSIVPDLAHYLMAFVVLAGFWVSHHMFFNHVKFVDRTMTWLSIFGLLLIGLVPFSTELAETYVNYPLAAAVFEFNVLLVGILFCIQWQYARKGSRLIEARMDSWEIAAIDKRMLMMPAISLAALGLAFAGITWSTLLYAVTPLAYIMLMKKR